MRRVIILSIGLILSLFSVAPASADPAEPSAPTLVATVDELSPTAEVEVALDPYIKKQDGRVFFDASRARNDGASEFALEVGLQLNRVAAEYAEQASGTTVRGMPGYGRWCGPGNSGPGTPTTTLDRLCMHHDKCYARRGYFNCSCDRQLVADINRYYNRMGRIEKGVANAIKIYFKKAPCRG